MTIVANINANSCERRIEARISKIAWTKVKLLPEPWCDMGNMRLSVLTQILSIGVTAAAGSRTLNVGTSAAGTDVVDGEVIPTNTDDNLPVGIFTSTGLTLHFSGFIGTVRIYIL